MIELKWTTSEWGDNFLLLKNKTPEYVIVFTQEEVFRILDEIERLKNQNLEFTHFEYADKKYNIGELIAILKTKQPITNKQIFLLVRYDKMNDVETIKSIILTEDDLKKIKATYPNPQ